MFRATIPHEPHQITHNAKLVTIPCRTSREVLRLGPFGRGAAAGVAGAGAFGRPRPGGGRAEGPGGAPRGRGGMRWNAHGTRLRRIARFWVGRDPYIILLNITLQMVVSLYLVEKDMFQMGKCIF